MSFENLQHMASKAEDKTRQEKEAVNLSFRGDMCCQQKL